MGDREDQATHQHPQPGTPLARHHRQEHPPENRLLKQGRQHDRREPVAAQGGQGPALQHQLQQRVAAAWITPDLLLQPAHQAHQRQHDQKSLQGPTRRQPGGQPAQLQPAPLGRRPQAAQHPPKNHQGARHQTQVKEQHREGAVQGRRQLDQGKQALHQGPQQPGGQQLPHHHKAAAHQQHRINFRQGRAHQGR